MSHDSCCNKDEQSCGSSHSHGGCDCCCHGAQCNCCCHSQSSCGCSCHDKHHSHAEELLELADDAWMELLMDLIKEEIHQSSGDQLKALAKLVAKTNHEKWKGKMACKADGENFKHQVAELMRQNKE